jgi:putative transposase
VSPGMGRRYALILICQVFRVPRSSVYAAKAPAAPGCPPGKRGPRPAGRTLSSWRGSTPSAASPFHGEGYQKIRARLAHRGLALSGKRVLHLRRQHTLLAPRRLGPPNGDPAHAGAIITGRPDVMGGPMPRF